MSEGTLPHPAAGGPQYDPAARADEVHTSGTAMRQAIVPAVSEAVERSVKLTLDATDRLANRNPATVLVAILLVLLAALGVSIAVGVWVKIQQDKDSALRADRLAAEQRESYARLEDARDRDRAQTTSQIVDMANRAALAQDKAVEAQRETTRVMLMVKGAIDDMRAESKRNQDMLKEQKGLLEKILECLKGKWEPQAQTAPAPRPVYRTQSTTTTGCPTASTRPVNDGGRSAPTGPTNRNTAAGGPNANRR